MHRELRCYCCLISERQSHVLHGDSLRMSHGNRNLGHVESTSDRGCSETPPTAMYGSLASAHHGRVPLVHPGHERGCHGDDAPFAETYQKGAISRKPLSMTKTEFYAHLNPTYYVHQFVARARNHLMSDPVTFMLGVA